MSDAFKWWVFFALIFAPVTAYAAQPDVVLWHAYGDAEAAGLNAAVNEYQAQTGQTVEVLQLPFGAYASRLESAIPTGRGPDLFIDAHERLPSYVRGKLVAPFGSDAAAFSDAVSVGESTYGIPIALKTVLLFYNRKLLPEPPATLEQIFSHSNPQGQTTLWPLVFQSDNAYFVAPFLHANGAAFISDNGEFGFKGDGATATLAWLADWQQTEFIPEESTADLVKQLFTSGQALTAISGPWFLGDVKDLDYGVVPIPTYKGKTPQPFVTVEATFLSAQSKQSVNAKALADFLATGTGAKLRVVHGRQIVTDPNVWELIDDPVLREFYNASKVGRPMPTHERMRLTWEPVSRAVKNVLRAGASPQDAVGGAQLAFAQVTRPDPEPRSPIPFLIGLFLAAIVASMFGVKWVAKPDSRQKIRGSFRAYAYSAHAFIALAVLVVAPLLVGTVVSFFAGRGRDLYFVGFYNYIDILTGQGGSLFANGSFWRVLVVTVAWTALNVVAHVAIGVFLAVILNQKMLRMRAAYRVLLILPWAVPSYVTAITWKGMFHRQFGAVNQLLELVGVEPVSWFAKFAPAFAANLTTNIWLGFPFMMVVSLGALAAIPDDLYEAASLDGATRWQQFRFVTWPILFPSILPAVALGLVWTFNMFNVVFLVSGGAPDGSTEILVSEAYRWAFTRGAQYGYAAAYAVLIFIILVIATRFFGAKLDGAGGTK